MADDPVLSATKGCLSCGATVEVLRFRCPRCSSEALNWFERALEIDPQVPGAEQMAEEARRQIG